MRAPKDMYARRGALFLPRLFRCVCILAAALAFLPDNALANAASAANAAPRRAAASACDRSCMTVLVDQIVSSMVAHDPYTLPLAPVYEATENSHPAALGMMTLWRTVTKAGKPDFLALDPVLGQAFFLMQIDEAGDLSVLWGRVKVVDRKITQLELYVNRSPGDHGFSFSASRLPDNVRRWMNPPASRVRATRAELEALSRAAFNGADSLRLKIARGCQFLEAGEEVGNHGLGKGFAKPSWAKAASGKKRLGCVWPSSRPTDSAARTVVIDQKLGIVVDAAMVRGRVYPYPLSGHMASAFIPDDMRQPKAIQAGWYETMRRQRQGPLLQPAAATGITMQVLQYYNGKLQGLQINVHLEGPGARSIW